jgi:diacylglycerol kinase (ATP)
MMLMTLLDPTKPVHLIINPHSGRGATRRQLTQLRTLLHHSPWEIIEHATTGEAEATHYSHHIAANAAAVVAWGGDGTINEVAAGLGDAKVPILICPAGTENLLAKELRISLNPQRLVSALTSGRIIECDVAEVNGRNFFQILGVGFDGEVVRRLAAARTGHISHLSYFWPIWKTFWEHNFPRMRVFVDDQEVFHGSGLAFVGNISRYAVGLRICPAARFDDGLLDLVVFPCSERTRLLRHAAWTLLRLHPIKGNVIYRQARNIRIESDETVDCQIDGDPGPTTPIDVRMTDHRMQLLIPRPRGGWSVDERHGWL